MWDELISEEKQGLTMCIINVFVNPKNIASHISRLFVIMYIIEHSMFPR